jgi:hypothetical protein
MRIKKKHVIKEINNIEKNTDDYLDDVKKAKNKIKSEIPSLPPDELDNIAAQIAANEPVNEVGKDKVHTTEFDRCVADVKKQPNVDNPYAICQASLGADAIKKSHRKKEDEDYTNETTVSITKGKLLETILNKKPRKVVKTIRVGDIKR